MSPDLKFVRRLLMASALIFAFSGTTRAQVTDLGTLYLGPNANGFFDSSKAFAINNNGDIVGVSFTFLSASNELREHAVLYRNGSKTDLGTLAGPSGTSEARGINNLGLIVGISWVSGRQDAPHAFIYSNGVMNSLGTLGGQASEAFAINDAGQVVGRSSTVAGNTHAFLYSGGVMIDLGTLGGANSTAWAINGSGQVVGESEVAGGGTHAFLYSNGLMTDLGTFGGVNSAAMSINNHAQIVGWAEMLSGVSHAFIYSNGVMTDLGTLPGGTTSTASSINDLGEVVGSANHPQDQPGKGIEGATFTVLPHMFLFTNGTMRDVTPTGWSDLRACFSHCFGFGISGLDINDNGVMTGWGDLYASSSLEFLDHAFMLVRQDPSLHIPTVFAGPDQTIACGGPVSFSATGNGFGDTLTYLWSGVLGETATGQNVTLNVIGGIAGSRPRIHVDATNSGGLTAGDTLEVNVQDTEPPVFTFVPPDMFVNTTTPVIPQPTATDNCGIARITTNTPAVFPPGPTRIGWSAADVSGNFRNTSILVTVDLNRPTCTLGGILAGPPTQLQFTAQDVDSGIQSVQVTTASNVTTTIPSFNPGLTTPLVITATAVDPTQSSALGLQLTDRAGNIAACDSLYSTTVRDTGKSNATVLNVPAGYNLLQIANGTPGVKKIAIFINGIKFADLKGLADGEVRQLNLSSVLQPGSNAISLDANGGKPGGTAAIVVSK